MYTKSVSRVKDVSEPKAERFNSLLQRTGAPSELSDDGTASLRNTK